MKLIRRKLKKSQSLLRGTDQGANLYVAHMNEFEEKAVEYRMKTGAYEDLSSSSIEEILSKVLVYSTIFMPRLNSFHLHDPIFSYGNVKKNAICGALESYGIYGRRLIIFSYDHPRYIDDIFFTFNEPKAKMETVIKKANGFHPNIKLEANTGSCVSFLDILIKNNNGILSTSVHHKPAAEPCVVPFISDHSRHVFSNIIQAALLRAVHYSSILTIFEKERRAIQLMLLYNW
ncbi:unnamed protein product [Rotaria socialis]|uniref:Helix-turn-helix domain-containing protein n=1 Tax=Rotaria socialis TaxID=392032 RepID=A0A820X6Z6_9BILA|nr:unnamed protein product [Rotaria socialis]